MSRSNLILFDRAVLSNQDGSFKWLFSMNVDFCLIGRQTTKIRTVF